MQIDGELPRLDGLRRRPGDAGTAKARAENSSETAAAGTDRLEIGADQAATYVAELMRHDPSRLHRVEDLRRRIAEGSYQADPESLADALLDRFPPGTSA